MQQIGQIVKNHTFKNKKGEDKEMDINIIPNNVEKYMAFMLGNHLTFIDSFQFMSRQSLSSLVNNLPNKLSYIHHIQFKDKKFELMKQKGVYPYNYMDSFDKFNESVYQQKIFSVSRIMSISQMKNMNMLN